MGRIQALRDDTQSQSSGSSQDENLDDVTQDLIAAFRYISIFKGVLQFI